MDNRPIIYSMEQGRSFDIASGWVDALVGDAQNAAAILGSTITTVQGFAATQTATPSLTIDLTAGTIFQEYATDATAYGPLPANSSQILQAGAAPSGTVTLSTSELTSGQSQWVLVQAAFAQVDSVAPNDPNGGVLLYYNSANPSQPFQGPGNSGAQQNTLRSGVATISLVYGTPASTGSEVPPSASAGSVGLYLIDLTFGQTQITNSEILVAGPSVGTNVPSNYPYAPFLAGLLNSHHSGTPGQAPQIKLGSEVQGLLPFTNIVGGNSAGQLDVTAATASGQAVNLSQFDASTIPNGYQKLPSGLIIQWGQAATQSASQTITLPIAAPNAILQVVASDGGSSVYSYGTGNYTTTSFTLYASSSTAAGRWLAITY